ncbi:hypothetical protein TcBrA4_0069720 [Trypanosoma cruzi]|nr:hypothetical protein TcBrA4_0069720 [Trypanosoma cruzi]
MAMHALLLRAVLSGQELRCDANFCVAACPCAGPAVPVLSHAVTPSMEYRRPVARGLTAQQLIGVIVGSVAAALLLIALILLLLYFCRDSRDNENAPKERTDPVTLVFTDIESSTAMWAACPEVMPDAVETHHRLIRSLIAKYRCYEVKTIGDSFMIACKSVFAAVQLVRELQQVFLQHDWGTSVIDDAYHKFEEGRAGRTRSTCRRPRAWTMLCTGRAGTACACESVCTPGCVTSGATR